MDRLKENLSGIKKQAPKEIVCKLRDGQIAPMVDTSMIVWIIH